MMKFDPRPFQQHSVDHAVDFLSGSTTRDKQLYAAPTGVGKSVIELLVQQRTAPDSWIITPRYEIVTGMLDKLGQPDADGLDFCISTPVKLRNRLFDGRVPRPKCLIFDEAQHHSASTWQQIDLLTGLAPAVAYTATPYRGSPASTRKFRDVWGEPLWLITYEEAIQCGYIRMPSYEVLPLVDDDVIELKNGEFDVTSLEAATVDRLGDLAEHCRKYYTDKWDRATIFSVPSSAIAIRLQQELGSRGLPTAVVNAGTSRSQRQEIFAATEACILALVHINIVSEGVDLKLRRYIDLDPTMSPVEWVQKLGRITRPGTDAPPEYICTNRNILRHAYVLDGVVPMGAIVDSERKFPPSERGHARVLGLEAIGRFKPTSALLRSGAKLYMYCLSAVVNNLVLEYCCLLHPTREPIWAIKANTKDAATGVKTYGTWTRCEPPNDVVGFGSMAPKKISEKQEKWWRKSWGGAAHYGLDPEQEIDKKNFQVLPVLADLGERL